MHCPCAAVPLLRAGLTAVLLASVPAPTLSAAEGFFRVEQREGRWWLLDPQDQPFLSKGVCHVVFRGDTVQRSDRSPYREAVQAKYGSPQRWREAAARRLLDWGFNSVGAWSDAEFRTVQADGRQLVDAPIVDLGARFVSSRMQGGQAWLHGIFPDVFDPAFASFCHERAREVCSPRKDDRSILGWFSDNELRWGPDWRGGDELLTQFLNLPAHAPGRAAALELLRERHTDVGHFNRVWKTGFGSWADLQSAAKVNAPFTRKAVYAQNEGEERAANEAEPSRAAFVADCEAFAEQLAERYLRITREALQAAAPNHLVFGCRFAYLPPPAVRTAAARYLDVISFNCYQTDPTSIVRQYAALGRPLLIGEFTFRAEDVGLPNTRGAGPKVPHQIERAAAFERYVQCLLADPAVVGYHWFQHNDQPQEGRFDGENSNYGLVNGRDEVYRELTRTMSAVNRQAEAWHRGIGWGKFRDPFKDRLASGWWWVRDEPSARRITAQGLEIRVQPGNMWGTANSARNVLARHAPDPTAQKVTASVQIEHRPTEQYEQVDLVWYYDDSHMVKIGQERVDGRLSIVMGREEQDRTRTIAILPLETSTVEVRFVTTGTQIRGDYRPTGTPNWLKAGECDLPVHGPPKISLQSYQGPAAEEHWARLADFRLDSDAP